MAMRSIFWTWSLRTLRCSHNERNAPAANCSIIRAGGALPQSVPVREAKAKDVDDAILWLIAVDSMIWLVDVSVSLIIYSSRESGLLLPNNNGTQHSYSTLSLEHSMSIVLGTYDTVSLLCIGYFFFESKCLHERQRF